MLQRPAWNVYFKSQSLYLILDYLLEYMLLPISYELQMCVCINVCKVWR